MTTGTSDQTEQSGSRKRVLVVDDDELVRVLTREIFERIGCLVSVAENGRLAMAEIANNSPDLVILDIIMPEKEGLETLLQLKREYPAVKVIAISSGGRKRIDDFLVIAERFGADAVLKKPIKPSVLLGYAKQLLWGNALAPNQPGWKTK